VDFDREIVRVYFALQQMAKYYHDENAHDLASEAVTRALEHRECYDPTRPLLAWCRAIMRNLWLNAGQKLERLNTVRLGDWETDGGEETDQRTITGEMEVLISEARSRSVSVDTLMDFAEGYSLNEIADARGLPLGTVKRRIHDGREMLSSLVNVK